MRLFPPIAGVLVAAWAVALPAGAGAASLPSGPGPRPGPPILYAPPAVAPQLTNAGVWRAEPILVSGASAYRDGEFLYQDFLYDDHGADGDQRDPGDPRRDDDTFSLPNGTYTYPTAERYAQNAADLVELRVRALADATAFRITLNTMLDPDVAATTIAIGDSAVSFPVPHGANATAPAQLFLTVRGTTADLRDAATGQPVAPAPTSTVDLERRQIEVRVPHAAWNPGTQSVRLAAAVGLWDAAADRYLIPTREATETRPGGAGNLPTPTAFFNVAFRYAEPWPDIHDPTQPMRDPRWWRDREQGQRLKTGDLGAFSAEVDFAKLAAGADDDLTGRPEGVPRSGPMNRILASRFEPSQGVDFDVSCGTATNCEGQLRGRLQPYAIYVPDKPAPTDGYGLTLLLHSLAANYNQFSASRNQSQFGERGAGHIVVTPAGRGPDGWYYGMAGADTFEVWADVAARYPLDPERAAVSGYSMGGYGTYKFATRYPDLFARANPVVGPPCLGISATTRDCTADPSSITTPLLPSVRHVPFLMWVAAQDELVPISGTTAHAQRFDELGLRYVFDVFSPADHFTLAVHDQYAPAAAFLGDAEVDRDPHRVTYVVNPEMDFPEVGLVGDHAYWVGGLRVRDTSGEAPRGTVDVVSEGFGRADPAVRPTLAGGGQLSGGTFGSIPYSEVSQTWAAPRRRPASDRLRITATNVSRIVVHARRARVSCRADVDVTTDGPVEVVLTGCRRTVRASGAGCRAAVGFRDVDVRPRGRGLRVDVERRFDRSFDVDVFRQSGGRWIIGNRRVARFADATGDVTWPGPRGRSADGVYVVRVRMRLPRGRTDVRRSAVQRRGGRFRALPPYYRRNSCGTLPSFKLERPVFGGRHNRALGISFRIARRARVSVRVERGGRVVRRFSTRARQARLTHRLRLASEGLPRGRYRVRITVRDRRGTVRAALSALRL